MSTEKIGVIEWLPVVRRSRVLYLKLRYEDARQYDIQPGDVLKVEIQAIKKGPRDQEDEQRER